MESAPLRLDDELCHASPSPAGLTRDAATMVRTEARTPLRAQTRAEPLSPQDTAPEHHLHFALAGRPPLSGRSHSRPRSSARPAAAPGTCRRSCFAAAP